MTFSERRIHPRHTIAFPIQVTAEEAEPKTREELLHDISDGGISFSTEDAERYQIDESLTVSIVSKENPGAISLSGNATVVWIEHDPFSLNKATVGVHFGELIEAEKYLP